MKSKLLNAIGGSLIFFSSFNPVYAEDSPMVQIQGYSYSFDYIKASFRPPTSVFMDKYEVTNAQYAEFLNSQMDQLDIVETTSSQGNQMFWVGKNLDFDGKTIGPYWATIEPASRLRLHGNPNRFKPIEGYENHPVTVVTWYGAKAYCEWRNSRLPTDEEWKEACGTRKYPWGNKNPEDLEINFNNLVGTTSTVGSHSDDISQKGIMDMAGNVIEWTSRESGNYARVMGGAWTIDNRKRLHCNSGGDFWRSIKTERGWDLGFRCAQTRRQPHGIIVFTAENPRVRDIEAYVNGVKVWDPLIILRDADRRGPVLYIPPGDYEIQYNVIVGRPPHGVTRTLERIVTIHDGQTQRVDLTTETDYLR